ncbi:MAG: transglycosylase family protein [Candidatus Levybacteria bacterium]|nr:transglycosylase family protein [Candidatus Levybacteria bacterium]MBP9815341.1 transglycosylase family protein [Candidatus Levybacteria bacterium]
MHYPEKTSSVEEKVVKLIIFIGERLAIILFAVFASTLLLTSFTSQAFSKQEEPEFVKPENNWYQKDVTLPTLKSEYKTVEYSISEAQITPTPSPKIEPVNSSDNKIWEKLAQCETHGNWSADTGNGYYGGLQFNMSSWQGTGGSGNPAQASKDEQIVRGKILQEKRGWGPWNACAKKLGLL